MSLDDTIHQRRLLPSRANTLYGRMLFAIGGALGLAIIIHALVEIHLEERHLASAVRDRVHIIGRSTADYTARAMVRGEHSRLADVLTFGRIDPMIYRLEVISASGEILHTTDPATMHTQAAELPPDWPRGVEDEFEQRSRERLATIWPIQRRATCVRCHGPGDQPIAWLRISASLSQIGTHRAAIREVVGGSAMFLFAALAAVAWAFNYGFVKRPIDRLIASMRRVEEGDLGVRCVAEGPEEFRKLGHSFNSMIERLEEARVRIQRYHDQLLTQAQRISTVGEMASSIAHEVKNPLAGVSGVMSVMLHEGRISDAYRPELEEALAQIQRVDHTISALLAFARTSEPSRAAVDLNAVVREVAAFIEADPAVNSHRVRALLEPDLPPVQGDGRLLFQAILNVGLNGLQAMRDSGELRLQSELDALRHEVRLVIEDTGPGVPVAQRDRIFKPFHSTKDKGAGLGLAIARTIVQEHEGSLALEPSAAGARFVFRLPAGGRQELAPAREPAAAESGGRRPATVSG